MKVFRNIALAVVVLTAVLVIGLCGIYKYMLSPIGKGTETIEVEIPANSSRKTIAKILKEKKLIRDENFFLLYVKLFKISDMKAGYYDLSKSMSTEDLVEELRKGSTKNPHEVQITFQEGITMRQVATIISSKTENSYDAVLEKANDPVYLKKLIEKYWFIEDSVLQEGIYYGLEGYLFPDTYSLTNKEVSIEYIFEKMLDGMARVLEPYKEDIEKSSYTIHQILSLASMVEKESATVTDRSKVASVFYNRLKTNMSLGSDVTTRYAFQVDDPKQRLTAVQYNTPNPYNTRVTDGSMNGKLPIGPICTISKTSLEASVHPEETNYLFFIANIQTLETFFYERSADFEAKKAELSKVNGGF
ncbi:MAG: endolytic transglycosylase MltG [Bacilli bacterium]|nr:endolytic transglycosylase MltG [Bacilli bacterium]